MMSCIFDTRNPERLTKADRQREGDIFIVSNRWRTNPHGIRAVLTFPSIQPGISYFDGVVADASGYNGALAARLAALPGNALAPEGFAPIWVSPDGRQRVHPFDLRRLDVVEAWRDVVVQWFSWASGIHHDYYTSLAWLNPGLPLDLWRSWDQGYALFTLLLGAERPDWVLVGQQFHITPLSKYVDGQFHEMYPQNFDQSFEQLETMLQSLPGKNRAGNWIFELREPFEFPEEYQNEVLQWVRALNLNISWGRDATAGVGLAEALERIGP